jgi:4-hydroxythreonine-4-phosphate dehydrogenase
VVVLAGTAHAATAAQLQVLRGAAWPILVADPDDRPGVRPALEAAIASALACDHDGLVLTLGTRPGQPSPTPDDPTAAARQALDIAAAALPVATRAARTALLMTGGETALQACRALGATAIEVVGEALPGIPLGVLDLPGRRIAVATKSGGFGDPDALVRTAEALLGRPLRRR